MRIYQKIITNFLGIEKKEFHIQLLIVSILTIAYYFSFFISEIPFIDDYERKIMGWSYDYQLGRPFAGTISSMISYKIKICFNTFSELVDIDPLNKIISLIILSISATVYCIKLFKIKNPFYSAVLCFFFIANPFFYESLSYSSDSIIIISSAVIALLTSLLSLRNKLLDLLIGSFFVFLFLGIYQATLNLFFASLFLIFLLEFEKNSREACLNFGMNIAKAFFGMVFYKFLILNNVGYERHYLHDHSEVIRLNANFFTNIYENFLFAYKKNIFAFFESPLITSFVIIGLLIFIFDYIYSNNNKTKMLIVSLISISSIIFFIFGFLILTSKMISEPRVYSSFSIFIVLVIYGYIRFSDKFLPSLKVLIFIPLIYLFIMNYSYRAMMEEQNNFNHIYYQLITSDLISLNFKRNNSLLFSGFLPYSTNTSNSKFKNKFLKSFHPGNIGDPWLARTFFKFKGFEAQYQDNSAGELFEKTCLDKINTPKVLIKNDWYTILKNGDTYMIAFPNSSCY